MHKDTDPAAPARAAPPYPRHPGGATEPATSPHPRQRPGGEAEPATRPYSRRSPAAPEFPGCRPVPLLRCDLDAYEGRFEYWDGDTGTAWVCEPTSPAHELPSHGLAGLVALIAAVRGSPIQCYGAMDLELRDERGERWRILQADQTLYLHPRGVELLGSRAMVVGKHNLPDVVLEVDHRTDVRRGKLGLYEGWGVPELWVEVPERASGRRASGRRPGLTMHRLEAGGYREAPESVAFGGWRAEEVHAALNEAELSEASGAVLARVGRAMGAREGTGPDDLPWLRGQRRQARAEAMDVAVREILASRGVSASGLHFDRWEWAGLSEAEIIRAALGCESGPDFRTRLRSLRG